MLKELIFFVAAVITVSQGQVSDGELTRIQSRHANFNQYYLYTRETGYSAIQIFETEVNPNILSNRTTVVLIHGHGGTYQDNFNTLVANKLLNSEDVNIIVVDWSVLASQSYSNAASAVPSVGMYVATYLSFLSTAEVELASIHLVGFNLGAHIAGWAGRYLGGEVARITALDPSSCATANRLSSSDAAYVEVIHTDGDGILSNGLGTQLGDADFFPNGGGYQPGCWGVHSCSHSRAWYLFAASIAENTFMAHSCNTMTQMRLNQCRSSITAEMGNIELGKFGPPSGIFRVNTKATYPY